MKKKSQNILFGFMRKATSTNMLWFCTISVQSHLFYVANAWIGTYSAWIGT